MRVPGATANIVVAMTIGVAELSMKLSPSQLVCLMLRSSSATPRYRQNLLDQLGAYAREPCNPLRRVSGLWVGEAF